jgi:hypothetical protein
MNQTIEKRKILIPFIILGARPTSTPSPKRDQLVEIWSTMEVMLSPRSLPIPQTKHKMNLINRLKIDRSQAIVGWGQILHLQFKNDKDLMLVIDPLRRYSWK